MKKKLLNLALAGFVALPILGFQTPQAEASTAQSNVKGTVEMKANLNVRNSASLSAKVIRTLPKGSKWKVYSSRNGMYYLGGTNWVSSNSRYVTYTPTNGASVATKKTTVSSTSASSKKQNVANTAKRLVGTPYKWGGTSPSGFDCSGFIYYVHKNNGYSVSRNSAVGYYNQTHSTNAPKAGDLVFFKNTYKSGISHIGIYLGNGQFVHAPGTGKRVKIDSLSGSYYKQHFAGYRTF